MNDTHALCEVDKGTGEMSCPVYRQLRGELAACGRSEASLNPVFMATGTISAVKPSGTKRKSGEGAGVGRVAVVAVEGSRRRRTISESPCSERKVFENTEEAAERVLALLREVLEDPSISFNDLD